MPKSRMRRASITMWSGILSSNRVELPTVEREPGGERADFLAHPRNGVFIRHIEKHLGDERSYLVHLGLAETARGDGGRAEPDAARVERRVGVERDRVLVDRDAGAIESLFGLL